MAKIGKTAEWYRKNPEGRKKHNASSKKWNESTKGKAYKKKKNATPEEMAKNRKRKAARRVMEAAGLVKKGDNKNVDHKKTLASGGSNSRKNLRVVSAAKNLKKNRK